MKVIGIDPGLTGAFVILGDEDFFAKEVMPIANKEIDFEGVQKILLHAKALGATHAYLERAMPLAMGAKHAFNYGRGFMALEIAVRLSGIPVTYVEPAKWTKIMHEGISSDLKPKAKSIVAVQRLFPQHLGSITTSRTGKMHEGIVDALLIAGFGLRQKKG